MAHSLKDKLWAELKGGSFVMVRINDGGKHASPMTVQCDDLRHDAIWFFTGQDSRLAAGGDAMAQMISKRRDLFACMAGTLVVDHDQEQIDRLWSPQVEAWYEHGKNDPNLVLLRMELQNAEIWTADPGIVRYFKLATGMTVREGEFGEHGVVAMHGEA